MNELDKNKFSLWKIHKNFKPHLKCWNDEYVVFDEITGNTLRIAQLEGYIVEQLLDSPATIVDLANSMQADESYSLADVKDIISHVLNEMQSSQLVEPHQE